MAAPASSWEDRRAEDAALMLRVGKGDAEAFESLYRRYSRPILNFFYRNCWNADMAEDCCQEVFARLWAAAPRYRPTGKFTTYLFQIAKNFWLNEREKLLRRPPRVPLEELPGGEERPDRPMEEELRERIREAVDSLDEPLRMVFLLSQYEGLPYKEVSEILDIPEGTVKSRMFKATKMLQERLVRYVEEGTA